MSADLARIQVLLVEDDNDLREGLREYFAAEGYHVVPFRRAEAAWTAVVSGCRPDVIVTDLALPGMSGVEFLRNIKAALWGRAIPVLVLSGWEGAERLAPGADAFLSKSAEPISVVHAIDRLVPAGARPQATVHKPLQFASPAQRRIRSVPATRQSASPSSPVAQHQPPMESHVPGARSAREVASRNPRRSDAIRFLPRRRGPSKSSSRL